ncbi:hypothetical protein Q7P37_001354 [Cladosporium fusiforme]
MARPHTQLASATVPAVLRFLLLTLEPLFAIGGVFTLLIDPGMYTNTMTRHALTTIEPASEFIYTELLGGWLHFAFTEAVVLRLVDDYRVWRLLCVAMLLSDAAYCHSCAQGIGGWSEWVKVGAWTPEEWVVTITTWPFVIARLAIVSGIGMRKKTE